MAKSIVFFDTEVGVDDNKIHDIGAVRADKGVYHSSSVQDFCAFISNAEYICGHNIIHHDIKFLEGASSKKLLAKAIDTLYLSPLLFPKRPYHRLLKDDKLQVEELNNPVNDSQKARDLFFDEVNAFFNLTPEKKKIFCGLLYNFEEFKGFFDYVDFKPYKYNMRQMILDEYRDKICANADIDLLVRFYPKELAYALALVGCGDQYSTTPPWLLHNFPKIENVIKFLCNTPCKDGCAYCQSVLDVHKGLKRFFGFDNFRTYNGEPLQEKAARAAVEGKSLLAVFPTGGGKSITFQLPALMAGKATHGLTVVISPLQSLMKDQVDNLAEKGIEDAVTVNGMLNPIERAEAFDRVASGKASILYISPEQLRSKTIERLLMSRNIVRFVIDEAHCFSAWGQDFRVDYPYIGDFIRKLQKDKKTDKKPIPVSCFTATAKQKVITDICDYFKKKLDLDLEIFASTAMRENLHYTVLHKETDAERRALYVGMTRAKSNLYIHTNTSLFDNYHIPGIEHIVDETIYGEPSEIMLQTTHKDVVLDFFKNKKEIIFALRSGTALKIDDVYLTAERNGRDVRVAKFSKAFAEILAKLKGKGHAPQSSEIRFIVAWKGEAAEEETPVLLIDLHLNKQ